MTRLQVTFICSNDRCPYFKQSRVRALWRGWAELSPFVKGKAAAEIADGQNCAYCKKPGEAR